MKRSFLLFLFLSIICCAQAQTTPKKSDLLGTWKVVRIEIMQGSDTLFVADSKSGTVFSNTFKQALAGDTSMTEETKQKTMSAMQYEVGLLLNMEVSFLKKDIYTVMLHSNKVEGTFNWDKKNKKLTTSLKDYKEESSVVLANKQLVLTDTNQLKRFIYERSGAN